MSAAVASTAHRAASTDRRAETAFFRILSIDGGGMRGIIPAHVLSVLESKIRAKTSDPLASLINYFDMFAGTSTGAILIAGLLCPDENNQPRYSPEKILDLYRDHGGTIFNLPLWKSITSIGGFANPKYSERGLCKVMRMYFQDKTLKDLLRPCLFTAYDIVSRRAFFFRQHQARRQAHCDFRIRDLIRASTAAPVLFPVAQVRSRVNRVYHLIDGGMFAYNPGLCVYAEVRRLHPEIHARHMAVLSLGTGLENVPYPYRQARRWGAIRWMRPMHYISSSGMSEAVDFQLQQLFLTCENKNQYLRVNAVLDEKQPAHLDDAGPESLRAILNIAIEAGKQYDKRLDEFADLLLARRQ